VNWDKLLPLSISLMIALSVIYIVVISNILLEEELEEILEHHHDLGGMILFSIASVLYALFAIWMYKSNSKVPMVITIVGSLGLIILYCIAMSEYAEPILGISPEDITTDAVIAKTLQVAIVVVLFIRLKVK